MAAVKTDGRIPSIDEQGSERLPSAAKGYLDVVSTIEMFCITVVLMCLGVILLPSWERSTFILLGGAFFALSLLTEVYGPNRLRMKYTTYSVDRDFVYITRGRFFRRTISISAAQILNVESVQGPLLRRFNLAKVKFICIADVESLTPLHVSTVTDIRQTLLSDPWGRDAR